MVKNIYLAEISFTDGKGSKIRPILLIKENSYGDFIFLPLTTNLKTRGTVLENKNITTGTLPKKSIVVTEKISVIASSLLLKNLATVNEKTFEHIVKNVCLFIGKK